MREHGPLIWLMGCLIFLDVVREWPNFQTLSQKCPIFGRGLHIFGRDLKLLFANLLQKNRDLNLNLIYQSFKYSTLSHPTSFLPWNI